MTTLAVPVMETTAVKPERPPGLLKLFWSGLLAFVYPPLSRFWPRAQFRRVIPIAVFNTLCAGVWGILILIAMYVWIDPKPFRPNVKGPVPVSLGDFETYRRAALVASDSFLREWAHTNAFDRITTVLGIPLIAIGAFLLPFFVILPFGARPGPNKPALFHVARTVLLGSGLVHWWGAAYVATFLIYAAVGMPRVITNDYPVLVSPLLLVFTGLSIWTLFILVLAVRREYRTTTDYPEPHDPWCDDCGYILTGIDPAGRCPECGRLIADSLGPDNRPPTAWEREPRFRNLRVVLAQIAAVYHHPRRLFFSMPTLTGQRAAQRWLLASTACLFVLALTIVPGLYISLDSDWNFACIAGSLAMALVWAVFGLMMVGIETAGIAVFSRLRGQRVYLATSSKVTAYSAILMVPWIVLGGAQLIAYTFVANMHQHPNGIQQIFHVGLRGEQVILALSLSIAHIGGLLWYELTVYRGIRAIQYANK